MTRIKLSKSTTKKKKAPIRREPADIQQWKYDRETGAYQYANDEIKIFISLWQHHYKRRSWLACVRWEYESQNYGTYIKLENDERPTKKYEGLLEKASRFVTKWLEDKKAESNAIEQTTEFKKI